MATPNNISVKIGNITLSTNDIPEKGIDLNKVDKESKTILSCFNTDNDKEHLSASEIRHAISVFASKDKPMNTDLGIVPKDGILVDEELSNVRIYDKQQKRIKNVADLKEAAATLVKNMVREKMQLQPTYNENWAKDSSGAHYKWNGTTFKKIDNVYFVDKQGNYKTKTKTDNPNKFIHKSYLANGKPQYIQMKTADGKKTYVNPQQVADKAGLETYDESGACANLLNAYKPNGIEKSGYDAGWVWNADKNRLEFHKNF
mgnify:CR=1 FL=1